MFYLYHTEHLFFCQVHLLTILPIGVAGGEEKRLAIMHTAFQADSFGLSLRFTCYSFGWRAGFYFSFPTTPQLKPSL